MGGVHTACVSSKTDHSSKEAEKCHPSRPTRSKHFYNDKMVYHQTDEGAPSDLHANEISQLMDAIHRKKSNMIQKVKALVSSGVDVNQKDEHGNTPLIAAVKLGQKQLIELFLQNKADPNIADELNGTPLYYAIISGQCSVAAMLIEIGSDVNYRPPSYKTADDNCNELGSRELCNFPLVAAIQSQCDQCFLMLVRSKADINGIDQNGRTAFVHTLAENPWSKMKYPSPGDPASFDTRAHGELPRSFASLKTGYTILHGDRIAFAHALLGYGADVMAVWEKILWCMWCQSPFDHEALELCIRALSLVNLSTRRASTPGAGAVFSALLYHGLGRHVYLFYLSGFNPSVPKEKLLFDSGFIPWLQKAETTPRTLQGACVVAIRRNLAGEGNVIHKTLQLKIPGKLKKLISLDIPADLTFSEP